MDEVGFLVPGDREMPSTRRPDREARLASTANLAADNWGTERDREAAPRKEPRRWRDKFREAIRGVKLGVRGHSSFFVHFFFAALALAAALALQCGFVEWCMIFGCVGLVLTAELFNSSIETLFHSLDSESKRRNRGSLDIAAGAVLIASLTAAMIGLIVFGRRILLLLHVWES
jgi:diacylglycerol kinase